MQAVAVVANKIENPKTDVKKTDKNISNNIDFLKLLLKNTKDAKKSIEANIVNEKKELQEKTEIQNLLTDFIKIDNIMHKYEDITKEVKNIIQSTLKQQNILLNKIELQNFKKIDNVKDLLKFANQKGLNIEKLTFDIAKNIKQSPKLKEDIKNIKDNKLPILQTTAQILSSKNKKSNNNVEKKVSLEELMNKNKAKTYLPEIPQGDKKKIDSKSALPDFRSDKKVLKADLPEIPQGDKTKIDSKSVLPDFRSDKKTKINSKSFLPDFDDNKKIKVKEAKTDLPPFPNPKEKITLNSLLNKKDDKDNVNELSKDSNKESLNINLQNQNINEIKAKQVSAKETINHFRNNLDEAIKNYKPPISKVNIELNPKNLGKVEVSIIQRGNNITLHMNTDQSNIALFQNHQAEFRQALTNIGFSNIDMSFNSNQEKERKQNQAKKSYKEHSENIEISDIEIEAKYKYA